MKIDVDWDPKTDGYVAIGSHRAIPGAFRAQCIPDQNDDLLPYEVDLGVVYRGERFECATLCIRQADGGPAVTPESLRGLPLRRLIATITEYRVVGEGEADAASRGAMDHRRMTPLSWPIPEQGSGLGPSDEALSLVATAYRIAYACGLPPTRYVEQSLRLSRATAGRWIREARNQGLLGETVPGRKGV